MRNYILAALPALVFLPGCITDPLTGGLASDQGAAIVGRVTSSDAAGKLLARAQGSLCPEVLISLNGSPADVVFGEDCSFVIDEVQAAPLIELRVEVPQLAISGTLELTNVTDAELIEIVVDVGLDSLSVGVVRRAQPGAPGNVLPPIITDDNVTIQLSAGVFEQSLQVLGNNFTLIGQAGAVCGDPGWTVLMGDVEIVGNNATFRNIEFVGTVKVLGNNTQFIHCCFDGALVAFVGRENGRNPGDDDDGDDDDGGDDDDNDDDDD